MTHRQYHHIKAKTPFEMGEALGRTFGPALQPYWKGLKPLSEGVQSYIADCYTLTAHVFPQYTAEIEGYAKGAGVSIQTLWHFLLEDDIDALSGEKCTSFVTNKGRLLGHNEDWNPQSAARLFILHRELAGKTLFEFHYGGTLGGNAFSVNGHGVAVLVNSQDATPVDTSMPRIPTNVLARFVAETADPAECVEQLKTLPRMAGYAHTMIDLKSGHHRLLEASQHDVASEEITVFPFIHANHYILDEMVKLNIDPYSEEKTTYPRYAAAQRGTAPRMDVEAAQKLLEDETGGPNCSLLNRRTLAGVVLDADAKTAHIRVAAEADKGWVPYRLDFLS